MADQHPKIAALRKLEASLHLDLLEREFCARAEKGVGAARLCLRERLFSLLTHLPHLGWGRRCRVTAYIAGGLAATVLLAMSALWWRLGNGPIDLDLATPWLTAAIEENFGANHRVEVGGTQLERDANGRTALRIRDIVVRDADGTIVASAPKAEVGISGSGIFSGHVRAERLSLVGAEMAVRIEPDSKVTVFAGSNKHPFVTASAAPDLVAARAVLAPARPERSATPAGPASHGAAPDFGALLAWIDSLGTNGLDGRDLTELGLKNGNLTVDDQRNGKQWTFQNINLSITRPNAGVLALNLSSENVERPWRLRAAMTRGENGRRIFDLETQKLPARELMLAMRVGDVPYEPDVPLSGRIRADIGADGVPQMIDGRIVVDKGVLIDTEEPFSKVAIDRAEFSLDWDAARQALVVPFQVISGGNRITLLAQLDSPREAGGPWDVKVTGGTLVLAAALSDVDPLVLNRFLLKMRLDPTRQRIDVEQGEFGNLEVGIAFSGNIDFASGEPRIAMGVAGNRMSVTAMKRLWPFFVSPKVRAWVEEHLISGTVERMVIATNAPMETLKSSGPPVPEDGLAIEITGSNAEISPIEGLPAIRDADMTVRITGRTATINLGRGNIEMPSGRKLSITNGVFEVPDTFLTAPPAKVRFRIDGPVPAAAELVSSDRLRDFSGAPIDPATSRGTLAALVTLGLPLKQDLAPGSSNYAISIDVSNFAAEHMVMGQKVEAAMLRINANNQGYQIKGDVKINGVAAALDYRKPRGDGDAEVRLQANLDESARSKLGLDLSGYMSGAIPIKLNGRVASADGESRFAIEADLTQARVDKLVPGWVKPPGRTARATFTLLKKPQLTRVEDLVLESPGASVKGSLDLNETGDIISANFPVFALSDGDKATIKAERGPDGALRILMRGDVFDGRGYIKTSMAGPANDQGAQQAAKDVDLDIKLGTVVGFHGETLRGVDVLMSRRGGTVTSFTLNAKLGRDTPLIGDLRGRGAGGRNVLYAETSDAGAFFRFTDTYSKIYGGQMWVAMDPPSADQTPKEGILNIRDFSVRGEGALDKIVANAPDAASQRRGVEFSRMRVEFTRSLGRFAIREGVVRGPLVGATVEGYIDYMRDDVRMRGTFVPFFGLNNMFGQIPIVGIFLGGGSNEGLLGLTYEVVGPPSGPVLRVNPISVAAPGLLRKFFEFPNGATGTIPQTFVDPNR